MSRSPKGCQDISLKNSTVLLMIGMGADPKSIPPHVRDIMAPNDANYRPHESEPQYGDEDHNESEDTMDFEATDATEGTGGNTPPHSPHLTSPSPCRATGPSLSTSTPNLWPPNGIPTGVTPQAPQVISSSDTSEFTIKHQSGNTSVWRKNLTADNVIAEATKATGNVLAQHMQDIAESSRELERSKIEVQLKLFSEQMEYQREKDRRIYENALATNENARLSILKQGDMVNCLAHLSSVLSKSLIMTSGASMPQSTPHEETTAPRPSCNATPLQTTDATTDQPEVKTITDMPSISDNLLK